MTNPTASGKLNRLIAEAEEGGLRVTAQRTDDPDVHSNVEQYVVDFEMPYLPVETALDSYNAALRVHVIATRWGIGSAKPFKLHVTEWTVNGHRELRPTLLPYAVRGMAEDLVRWLELRAERAGAES